jgi:hypothetical protein
MQSSVAAIRGTRLRTSFVRPSSRHRERQLGLQRASLTRPTASPAEGLLGGELTVASLHAARALWPVVVRVSGSHPLRREPRYTWTWDLAARARRSVVDPPPWRA